MHNRPQNSENLWFAIDTGNGNNVDDINVCGFRTKILHFYAIRFQMDFFSWFCFHHFHHVIEYRRRMDFDLHMLRNDVQRIFNVVESFSIFAFIFLWLSSSLSHGASYFGLFHSLKFRDENKRIRSIAAVAMFRWHRKSQCNEIIFFFMKIDMRTLSLGDDDFHSMTFSDSFSIVFVHGNNRKRQKKLNGKKRNRKSVIAQLALSLFLDHMPTNSGEWSQCVSAAMQNEKFIKYTLSPTHDRSPAQLRAHSDLFAFFMFRFFLVSTFILHASSDFRLKRKTFCWYLICRFFCFTFWFFGCLFHAIECYLRSRQLPFQWTRKKKTQNFFHSVRRPALCLTLC